MAESKRAGDKDKVVHVYDGIVEEDNELPRWWLATFWGAIVFAVIYWVVYHSLGVASLPLEAYGEEMAKRAGSAGEVSNDLLEAMAQVPGEVEGGKKLFETHCAVCHGQSGEGLIGPNLTDGVWIHGGAAMDVYKSIRDGIPSAGMPNWGPPLGEANTRKLATFVLTLRGTNVPGKEPQGTPWPPEGAEPTGGEEGEEGAGAPAGDGAGEGGESAEEPPEEPVEAADEVPTPAPAVENAQ